MTRCYEDRLDLASYALGLLDESGCAQIEAHLVTCDACAEELEGMLGTADVLAGVDRDATLATIERDAFVPGPRTEIADPEPYPDPYPQAWEQDEPRRPGTHRERPGRYPLPSELPAPGRRRRLRGRRLTAMLAAAALVIVAGAVLSLWPSGNSGAPDISARPGGTPSAQPVTPGAGGATARESDAAGGKYFWAVNPNTGTRLDIMLAGKQWGTLMSFSLSEGRGPLRCRLVTVDLHGTVEVVSSWQVPAEGFGTPAHPERLRLQASSALPVSDIARVAVQALDQAGQPTSLLDLQVR
jgi:hypothetical protein